MRYKIPAEGWLQCVEILHHGLDSRAVKSELDQRELSRHRVLQFSIFGSKILANRSHLHNENKISLKMQTMRLDHFYYDYFFYRAVCKISIYSVYQNLATGIPNKVTLTITNLADMKLPFWRHSVFNM